MKVSLYVSREHGVAHVDTLAIATNDLILTAVARLDLLDTVSLGWLADQMINHENESSRVMDDNPLLSLVFRAVRDAITHKLENP